MKSMRRAAALLLAGCIAGVAVLYIVGTVASYPAPAIIGAPPADLHAQPVEFVSASGATLSGWFLPGRAGGGSVLLMHGIRANRLEMLSRARFLHTNGFSVLLFDFQASGASTGRHITFGYLEAADARSAFDFLRGKTPGERIGVIGMSMGGAAAVLADPPLEADAMVLEAVYSDFHKAVENRLVLRCGHLCGYFTPLLTLQVKPRLGFDPAVLSPAEHVARLRSPLLIIAGELDLHAPLEDVKQIFASAREPKELWVVPGAPHADFHTLAREEYERRILAFLSRRLRS